MSLQQSMAACQSSCQLHDASCRKPPKAMGSADSGHQPQAQLHLRGGTRAVAQETRIGMPLGLADAALSEQTAGTDEEGSPELDIVGKLTPSAEGLAGLCLQFCCHNQMLPWLAGGERFSVSCLSDLASPTSGGIVAGYRLQLLLRCSLSWQQQCVIMVSP
jgi:hypothetical protein